MYYIYAIQNKLDLRVYVGQTVNPKRRCRDHKWLAKNDPEQYIHRAMIKHGVENFIFQIIDQVDDGYQIDNLETDWINWFKSRNKKYGYNLAPGGDVAWNRGLPPEQQPMYGKHHSEESKKRSSISNTGKQKPHSKEWLEKMSVVMSELYKNGRILTKEWKNNIKKSKQNISIETRKKMSNSHLGKIISDEIKDKMSKSHKSDKCYFAKLNWDLVNRIRLEYSSGNYSQTELAKKYNVTVSTMNSLLRYKTWRIIE